MDCCSRTRPSNNFWLSTSPSSSLILSSLPILTLYPFPSYILYSQVVEYVSSRRKSCSTKLWFRISSLLFIPTSLPPTQFICRLVGTSSLRSSCSKDLYLDEKGCSTQSFPISIGISITFFHFTHSQTRRGSPVGVELSRRIRLLTDCWCPSPSQNLEFSASLYDKIRRGNFVTIASSRRRLDVVFTDLLFSCISFLTSTTLLHFTFKTVGANSSGQVRRGRRSRGTSCSTYFIFHPPPSSSLLPHLLSSTSTYTFHIDSPPLSSTSAYHFCLSQSPSITFYYTLVVCSFDQSSTAFYSHSLTPSRTVPLEHYGTKSA